MPFILVQTKMDLASKDVENHQRNMSGQTLASEMGIKVYKEISSKNGEINEALESIMMTVLEPRQGLSKEKLKQAEALDTNTDFFGMFK